MFNLSDFFWREGEEGRQVPSLFFFLYPKSTVLAKVVYKINLKFKLECIAASKVKFSAGQSVYFESEREKEKERERDRERKRE